MSSDSAPTVADPRTAPTPGGSGEHDGPRSRRGATRPRKAKSVLRPEIQFLRAVAVTVVVVYHLWPSILPGGFVGVDMFFAISGFLICAHLLRELEKRGKISLAQFWARRARRLLPAAFLVLITVAIGVWLWVPQAQWQQFFREIGASALYVENWVLASDAVDYLAAENDPSPVQHFWSLSVEEQFYLIWPVLMMLGIGLAWLLRSRSGQGRVTAEGSKLTLRGKNIILVLLALVTVSSLAYSVFLTATAPPAAYFVTTTRAWEFGAGALLAMLAAEVTSRNLVLRTLVSWLGWAAIVVTLIFFTGDLPFPSYTAALPIIGTLMVIWAGSPETRWSPTPFARLAPVQWLGGVSYSMYLWHWPLIVLAGYYLGRELGLRTQLLILVGSVVLAWLTKIIVEDPARSGAFLAKARPRRTYLAMVLGMALIGGGSFGVVAAVQQQAQQQEQEATSLFEQFQDCLGASGLDQPDSACATDPALDGVLMPDPNFAGDSENLYSCDYQEIGVELEVCDLDPDVTDPDKVVALIGDSHARQLRPALAKVAEDLNWQILSLSHASCMYSDAEQKLSEPRKTECSTWNDELEQWFDENPQVDYVIASTLSDAEAVPVSGKDWFDTAVDGYLSRWDSLPDNIEKVMVVRDNPRTSDAQTLCVQNSYDGGGTGEECAGPREDVLLDDAQAVAGSEADPDKFSVIDMTDLYCDDTTCFPTRGHVMIHRDNHHVTQTWAITMAPRLEEEIRAVVK